MNANVLCSSERSSCSARCSGYRYGFGLALRGLLVVTLVVFPVLWAPPQQIDMDALSAEEEFRWGVRAFQNARYNEAIMSFEQSLAHRPDVPIVREWLGRAYFYSGFYEPAIDVWEALIAEGYAHNRLANRIELIRASQGVGPETAPEDRYVVSAEINGRQAERLVFQRPTSVEPLANGSFMAASYGTHEIHVFNANGVVTQTIRGGLEGFNRPFDIARDRSGRVYVSEFGADRISVLDAAGRRLFSFGGRGIGEGSFLGPQYLTLDDEEFIYVSDWGNRRVSKFDREGGFVLSFGRPRAGFSGLSRPTGLVYLDGYLYVADAGNQAIIVFDESGNYVRAIRDLGLTRPESLSPYPGGRLLVANSSEIVLLDPERETVRRDFELDQAAAKITSVQVDANGNIITTDFDGDKIMVLSPMSSLYAGLDVRIDRVNSDNHPEVLLEMSVRDRSGRSQLGLGTPNFVITEDAGGILQGPEVIFAGHERSPIEAAVVVERHSSMGAHSNEIRRVTEDLLGTLGTAGRSFVVGGEEAPGIAATRSASIGDKARAAAGGDYHDSAAVDRALRLAVGSLIDSPAPRELVLVSDGATKEDRFRFFGLQETLQYLQVNDVRFSVVYLEPGIEAAEFEYLVEETGGRTVYAFEAAGLSPFVEQMLARRTGRYVLRYVSAKDTEFGRRYIPLEVEVAHLRRTGRDETGYFAPLRF